MKIPIRFNYDLGASTTLLLRSCRFATIRVILTKISNRSEIAVQWNGGLGHRPVIVKRAVIGSKSVWKLSTIFLSCKVFHDWSIIKLGNVLYLLDGYIFAVLFETTSNGFC